MLYKAPFHENHKVIVLAQGTITSGALAYHDIQPYGNAYVLVCADTIASGATLDVAVVQATDSSGTGKKAITHHGVTAAITQMVDADDDKQRSVEVQNEAIDSYNNFSYITAELTITGTVSGTVLLVLGNPKDAPVTQAAAYDQQKFVIA